MKIKASKRYKKLIENKKDQKLISIDEAIKKIKSNCTAKFDESIDVSMKINLKQKKEEVNLRTLVNLPHGNGKKIRIAVLCEENKSKEALDAGAKIAGSENLINDISIGIDDHIGVMS